MKSVTSIKDFKGKKVFVRVDFDVDLDEKGNVVDDTRISNSLESVKYVLQKNGIVIIGGHYGRDGASIEPIFKYIKNNLALSFAKSFKFVRDPLSEEGKKEIRELKKGDMVLIENMRMWPEEEVDDVNFARNLAELVDVYVNEAFSASHRSHASIVGIPKFIKEKYAGVHFVKEVEGLSKAFNPPHPFLFILGGAKLETKIPLLEKFLNIADSVFVGGTLAAPASKDPNL